MTKINPKKSRLLIIGIVIAVLGSLTNGFFVVNNVGGILREFMRFTIIVGILLVLLGILKRSKKTD